MQGDNLRHYLDGVDSTIWINLDRCGERRKKMETLLANFSVPNIRLSASDGKNEDVVSYFHLTKEKAKKPQYGCLLSHLRSIRQFHESEQNVALILEDDVCLDFMPYWNKTVKQIIADAPEDWEIIMLSFTSLRKLNDSYTPWSVDPNNWQLTLSGTSAYVINRKGSSRVIEKLLRDNKWTLPEEINHVADEILYATARTYVYQYPLFIWPDNCETTIGEDGSYLKYHKIVKAHFKSIYESLKRTH